MIVFILGKLIEDVIILLKVFRDFGVIVFCIGIGKMYNEKEFDDIVIDLDVDYVLIIDVVWFGFVIKVVKGKICKGKY